MTNLKYSYYLDPSEMNNDVCTFMLPSGCIMSNLVLTNVGASVSNATANTRYPYLAGVYSLVRNIKLFSNGKEISKTLNVDKLCQIFNEDHYNADNFSLFSNLDKTSLTFRTNENINIAKLGDAVSTTSNGKNGMIFLSKILPMLNCPEAQSLLRGDLFPNLRIEISWNKTPANYLFTGASANDVVNFNRPVLSFDIINQKIPRPPIYTYYEYLMLQIPVPSQVIGASSYTQYINERSTAFAGKYVYSLYILKVPLDPTATDLKNIRSVAYLNEQIQFNLNSGRPLFTMQGLTDAIGKIGPTKELFLGGGNVPLTTNMSPHQCNNSSNANGNLMNSEALKFASNMSIVKVDINQIMGISDIFYQRDIPTNAGGASDMTDMAEAFTLTFVAVIKRIENGDGSFNIQ